MGKEKTEQTIEPVADAEGIQFVVKAVYIADPDGAEGLFDRRPGALVKEERAGLAAGACHIGEDRDKGQKTLVDEIVIELPFQIRVDGEVDNFEKRVEQRPVFRQAVFIHVVRERRRAASVIIEKFIAKINGRRF